MIPYAVQANDITIKHLGLLEKVRDIVTSLPDKINGRAISCHDVCVEVVKQVPGLIHRRGHFFIHGVEHSWLEIVQDHPAAEIIIDAYPIAVASGPILVTMNGLLNPWRLFYMRETS